MSEARAREWEKMVSGASYDPRDPELVRLRARARRILRAYNASSEEREERRELLLELLGRDIEGLWIEPPFFCDYGSNIGFGRNVYLNFNCVILDVAPVEIGDNVLFGPAVQVYTATHSLEAEVRRSGLESAKAIRIASDVWIGGAAILNPGISIGAGTVIGSGSVVTRNIPAGVLAAGNPCRVVRGIGPAETRQRPRG